MWAFIGEQAAADGSQPFKELADFALDVLALPHSSCECERCFSKVNLNKTKLRNRLVTRTVNGILLASQCVKGGGGAHKFKVTDAMYSCMTVAKLYPPKKKKKKVSAKPMEPTMTSASQSYVVHAWSLEDVEQDVDSDVVPDNNSKDSDSELEDVELLED